MSEIKTIGRSLKAAGVTCKAIQGHDGTFWPHPVADRSSETATLLLRRATVVSGRAVEALVAIRPDLDASRAKTLAKDGERRARKPLLVDRPLTDIEVATRILKRNGLRVDIVPDGPEAVTAGGRNPSQPTPT
ncbi:hypothetical protein FAIPA1_210108 [Frankia sp. AiPs1]|uniref:hypothetical protein n=1 Tax=Frankia sp. AiPa1 TaxID=573492 RepID=UPI00202B74F7|nr:hypothetical protein [Frankia sp. AiPa1]MCL9758543.1 hypothetical protein [Frankia sp. AiPa1]